MPSSPLIWGAAGVNSANVSMTATETLTSNERVLAADPMVRLIPAEGDKAEVPGGKAAEQTSADDGDIETLHLRPGR